MGEYNDILSIRRGKEVISVAEMAQRYFPKENDKEKVRRNEEYPAGYLFFQ